MKKKKIIFDLAFIVIASLTLTLLIEFNLAENYIGFSLIPLLLAYYLGQLVERTTRAKSERKIGK